MKTANQMNRVSQCPSHDTGKLAPGDKLASSALSPSLPPPPPPPPVIMISESWRRGGLETGLCPDWAVAPACDHWAVWGTGRDERHSVINHGRCIEECACFSHTDTPVEAALGTERWELVAALFYKGYLEPQRVARKISLFCVPEIPKHALHVAVKLTLLLSLKVLSIYPADLL